MTKAELVDEVSRVSDLTRKHTEVIVDAVFTSIVDALQQGDKIELRGFGVFKVTNKKTGLGRNPKTGEEVPIKPRRVLVFRASHVLKDRVNKGGGAS